MSLPEFSESKRIQNKIKFNLMKSKKEKRKFKYMKKQNSLLNYDGN